MHQHVTHGQRIILGLAALVLVIGLFTVGIKAALGAYADDYTLYADFPRSGQGLDTFSTVKIRGVTVGSVDKIALQRDGTARVTLRIRREVKVPDTVVASAEPLSVFGPKFIRLDLGEHEGAGPYLRHDDVIEHTAPPTEITDLVSTVAGVLDAIDPEELLTIISTLAQGVDGLGPELGRTVDNLATVTDVLAAHAPDTPQFLADLATLARSLADHADSFLDTARDISPVLDDLAQRPDELAALLAATSRLSADLADLVNGHAPALHDFINGLAPAVNAIYQQLALVPDFLTANTVLIGALANGLLTYQLPDGHILGVIRGPMSADPCFTFQGLPLCPPIEPSPPQVSE